MRKATREKMAKGMAIFMAIIMLLMLLPVVF